MKKLSRFAQRFGIGRALCLMLLFVLVLLRVWDPAPIEELRLRTFDFYQMTGVYRQGAFPRQRSAAV